MKAGAAMLTEEDFDFKTKSNTTDQEGCFLMTKGQLIKKA